jgi:WD40 repeat protein
VVFSEQDGDFLCLTGGSDQKLKLWDLRQKRCIRDYGGDDEDDDALSGPFHTDSIWCVERTSTFEACFTGGRDGSIFHTDLAGD